jgi:hypothetical protein
MTLRAAGVLFLVILVACGDDQKGASSSDSHEDWRRAVAAVCAAAAHANSDREAAEDLFMDKAHGILHDIADAVSNEDRETAARLLEAKNLVELRLEMTTRSLQEDFEELARRSDDALDVLDVERVGCAEGADQ